ncbi:MAG TPA: YdcF family protein [Burkholderiales bacterium]|nr:YdcF family protein [Burkholderiales bacterium]
MSFIGSKILASFLLPPLNLLLLAAAGVWLATRRRMPGLCVALASLAGLYGVSTPFFSANLLSLVEVSSSPPLSALRRAGAIVVLGGGTRFNAPEYGGDTVGAITLERLRWAARLHRLTGLPLLVCGGRPFGSVRSEAEQMRTVLEEDFTVPVRWTEDRSGSTLENASNAWNELSAAGIRRIILVTHAAHMRRARLAFERAGFEVVASPTGFARLGPLSVLSFLPDSEGLRMGRTFFHEVIGLGWYYLRLPAAADDVAKNGKAK